MQVIILLVAYFLILVSYSQNTKQQQNSAIFQTNHTILANTRYVMNAVDTTTQFPLARTSIQILADPFYQSLVRQSKAEKSSAELDRLFLNRVSELMLQIQNIDSIFLFSKNGNNLAYKTTDLYYMPIGDCTDSSWRENVLNKKGEVYIMKPAEVLEIGCKPNPSVLYACRALRSTDTFQPICIILVGIKTSDISIDFDKQKMFPEQCFGIYDEIGRKLFGDDNIELTAKEVTDSTDKNSVLSKTVNGTKYKAHISYDNTAGIYSVIETPESLLLSNQRKANSVFNIIGIIVILSNIVVFLLIMNSITKPLQKLVSVCHKIGKGDFTARISDASSGELGYLMESFNKMSEKVEKLVNEVYLRNITERDLELQMLRSQINPHFLYNTLESMRMAAYTQGSVDLAEMCRLLANVLRYGVTMPNHVVTVKEELDHLNDYTSLLDYRFHDSIKISTHMDKDIESLTIIKLILQPVVENCINHGVNNMERTGSIQIWGYRQNDCIVFTISDNGAGMTEETLNMLRGYIDNKNSAFKSIGLKNIQRRIRLYYGEDYGVSISSQINKGTSVSIMIPVTEELPKEHSLEPPV